MFRDRFLALRVNSQPLVKATTLNASRVRPLPFRPEIVTVLPSPHFVEPCSAPSPAPHPSVSHAGAVCLQQLPPFCFVFCGATIQQETKSAPQSFARNDTRASSVSNPQTKTRAERFSEKSQSPSTPFNRKQKHKQTRTKPPLQNNTQKNKTQSSFRFDVAISEDKRRVEIPLKARPPSTPICAGLPPTILLTLPLVVSIPRSEKTTTAKQLHPHMYDPALSAEARPFFSSPPSLRVACLFSVLTPAQSA